jgi:hypothetical protein
MRPKSEKSGARMQNTWAVPANQSRGRIATICYAQLTTAIAQILIFTPLRAGGQSPFLPALDSCCIPRNLRH